MLLKNKKHVLFQGFFTSMKKNLSIGVSFLGLTCSLSLMAQGNGSGCDQPGADCIIVEGNPPGGGPGTTPVPGDCQNVGDPECQDDGMGDSPGGGGGGSGGNSAQCLAFFQDKPPNCHTNPGANYSASSFVSSNMNAINPLRSVWEPHLGGYVYRHEFQYLTAAHAHAAINALAQSFYDTADYMNSRATIWAILAPACQAPSIIDRPFCLQEQADFLASIRPMDTGGGSWSGSLTWGGGYCQREPSGCTR